MDNQEKIAFGIVGLVITAILVAVILWTDNNIDFWLTYFNGKETDCPLWLSSIATILLNGVALIFNVLTEIVKLVI